MKKLNIVKIIDQYGWAYDFITREQARYSKHNIMGIRIHDILSQIDDLDIDILYFPCPDINKHIPNQVIDICRKKNIKIIGGYCGEIAKAYSDLDLALTISPGTYSIAKSLYGQKVPVIFLPESIDTNYFTPFKKYNTFQVGWAGSYKRPLKRTYLLDKLNYKIKIQCNRDFYEGKTQKHMLDFYQSIDTLVLVSNTECMPRVVLEAMSCSLPVVSTKVGSIPFVLEDEWIVPVNPDKIVIEEVNNRLTLLNKYSSLRKEVGQQNRNFILNYLSWKKNQELWDKTFDFIITDEYNKISELSMNYINSLPKGEYFYKLIEKTNCIYTFSEIIDILNKSKINFWLLEQSCLDCIKDKKLNNSNIIIGVNLNNYKLMLQYLVDNYRFICDNGILTNGNFKIHVKSSKINKTKSMILENKTVQVPFPVIRYLETVYGKNWEIK